MQNKLLSVLLATSALTLVARAQDANPNSSASPAPDQQAVQSAAPAPQTAVTTQPAPNQVIYAPRLPTPAELTNAAGAQGVTVEQINQSATQITVTYRFSNGQTNTVAYQLLSNVQPAPTTVVAPSPAPTVVYETAPRVIYRYDPWYPRYYYPPVSLNLGFGYYHGWGGGGYHHHRHWR